MIWGKLKLWAITSAAFIAAAFAAYFRIREDGKSAAQLEQAKARDNLQEHYDDIDRQAVDPAGSYYRLRGLSNDKSGR